MSVFTSYAFTLIPPSGHLSVDSHLSTSRFHHHSTLLPWGGDSIPSVKAATSHAASPGSGLQLCNLLALARSVLSVPTRPTFAYGPFIALYWKFVYVDRKEKVESGERTTSLSFLLADQRGAIGKALASLLQSAEFRTSCFASSVCQLSSGLCHLTDIRHFECSPSSRRSHQSTSFTTAQD
jgi:hypothetical protein